MKNVELKWVCVFFLYLHVNTIQIINQMKYIHTKPFAVKNRPFEDTYKNYQCCKFTVLVFDTVETIMKEGVR